MFQDWKQVTKFIVCGGRVAVYFMYLLLKNTIVITRTNKPNSCGTLNSCHSLDLLIRFTLLEISVGQRLFLVNIESCQCLDKARTSKSDLGNGLQVSTTLL